MKKKTVLITGGAGFIGSHLCEKMLAEKYQVICLDNLDEYYDPEIKRDNLTLANQSADFTFIQGDILDLRMVSQIFAKYEIDLVIHLAAKAGVRPSIKDPLAYNEVNVKGTLVILEACREHGIKNLVFASSSSVYGKTERELFSEDDPANCPISPYGASKKSAELICHTYHHLHALNILCLRFFTVYGPRQRPDLAIHKFTRLISEGQPVPIFGDGTTSRDYTYIEDIINGVVSAVGLLENSNDPVFEIINLGGAQPVRLDKLLSLIETNLEIKAEWNKLNKQPGDLDQTFADVSKAKRLLSYQPGTRIEDGIKKFIDWYKAKQKMRVTTNA